VTDTPTEGDDMHNTQDQGVVTEAVFLPPVTFTDARQSMLTFYALSAASRAASENVIAASRDETVTRPQFDALVEKHRELQAICDLCFAEWERLTGASVLPDPPS